MIFFKYHQSYHKEQLASQTYDTVIIKRLLKYFLPYWHWLFIAIILLIIARAIESFIPLFLGWITHSLFLEWPELEKGVIFHHILKSCIQIIGLLALIYCFDAINVFLKSWIGQKALYQLRIDVYQQIQNMPLSYFDKNPIGRLMTRAVHDVEQINQMFTEGVVPIIGNLLLFIGIGICLFILNWKVGIAIVFFLPVTLWLTNRFRTNQKRCYEMVRSIVSAMNVFVQEHLMGVTIIRNFGRQKIEKQKFEEINEDHRTANLESIHHFSYFIAGIELFQNLSLILVFLILVKFTPSTSGFDASTFFTFSLYVLMFFRPLSDLAERYNVLQSAMAAAERLFSIFDQPKELSPKKGLSVSFIETISFENVWFAYEKENWILKGVTFSLSQGESIALVGMTGSGKTTIISLLLRFYECQKGSIKINNHDIKEYSLETLRKLFSVVLQDPVIFSGTIADNISLYDPSITEEQINKISDYLNMTYLIDRHSKKLHTHLKEHGTGLSTGEMQLLSMARALAHARSGLILDEATANIDSQTERIIQEALKKILSNTTALVIAHRLSTIKDVNRIVVLHDGTVNEIGTHQELLKKGGIYEKLYRLQFI